MEFLQIIDYSSVVDVAAQCIAVALPIGMIFGLCSKACNLFLSLVFGKEKVNL